MYDQWNEFYREGVRTPEKDYPVSIDVVKAPIDEVIFVGQLYSVVEKIIKATAGSDTDPGTTDAPINPT